MDDITIIKDDYRLLLGDCLDRMKEIPDGSVDMVLCDLPYGGHTTANKWDNMLDLKGLFQEYGRIIKEDGCIALNGTLRFGVQLVNTAPDLFRYEWVWQKDNGTNFPHVRLQPFRNHEFIFIFGKGRITYGKRTPMKYFPQMTEGKPYKISGGFSSTNWACSDEKRLERRTTKMFEPKRYPTTIQKFNREKGLHPTQKPVALLEYLIRTYTNPGETVLDNCMGSGSTGVACINTGRKFVGIEKDEKYFGISVERIERAVDQQALLYTE